VKFIHFSTKNLGFYLEKKNSSVDSTNFANFLIKFSKISLSKKCPPKKKKKAVICMEELVSLLREIGGWCHESWQG
jgi:hypothetical protein